MFYVNRWAAAYLNSPGIDAAGDLERLKVLSMALNQTRRLSGISAALGVEKLLRDNTGSDFDKPIRFIALLISKNCFRRLDSIIAAAEKKLDEQRGILNVTVESAAVADSALEDKLRKMLEEKTGAPGIRLHHMVVPELIAGYRLRIGGLCIDASLARQLKKMAEALSDNRQAAGAF